VPRPRLQFGFPERAVFAAGVVRYGDIFGNEYETEYRFYADRINAKHGADTRMKRPPGRLRTFVKLPNSGDQKA
jgi:hypothetical protein